MLPNPRVIASCIIALFAAPMLLLAQEDKAKVPSDKTSATQQQIVLDGKPLHYEAKAGTLVLKGDDEKPKASVFYVAYTKTPATQPTTKPSGKTENEAAAGTQTRAIDAGTRPITFVFNGGPGAAAVWLHMGTAGPKRVKLTEIGDAPPPPHQAIENPHTWLDATDLVFIDPVGTGFSRPAPGEKQEQFSGVQEDVQWVGEFIRLYLTRNQRWSSPKFLAGESYGTTRAAALSQYLLDRHGIALNGIVFISVVFNFQTISFSNGNETPYALYLPSFAAIAAYHKKLPPETQKLELPELLKQVETWTTETYLPALARGRAVTGDQRKAVIDGLRKFTGLPAETIEKADLRVDPNLFRAQLLADKREVLGRFDARMTGYNPDALSRHADFDPSLSQYLAAYTTAFNIYIRQDLKWESDLHYEVLSGRVHPWNFGRAGNGYLDVSDDLSAAMRKNPHLKILLCSGWYDLATPYFATITTANHLDLPAAAKANVKQTFYPGGHMMYHHQPSLEQLHKDVKAFVESSVSR